MLQGKEEMMIIKIFERKIVNIFLGLNEIYVWFLLHTNKI